MHRIAHESFAYQQGFMNSLRRDANCEIGARCGKSCIPKQKNCRIRIANRTSRSRGVVGTNAIVPRLVPKYATKRDLILDYGAGKDGVHAKELKRQGYKVTAHEFGDNYNPDHHDAMALNKQYDLVYASNVINTQSSPDGLSRTIRQIKDAIKPDTGKGLINYPDSPRKMDINAHRMQKSLSRHFGEVE